MISLPSIGKLRTGKSTLPGKRDDAIRASMIAAIFTTTFYGNYPFKVKNLHQTANNTFSDEWAGIGNYLA
jgi:hypothetical protein